MHNLAGVRTHVSLLMVHVKLVHLGSILQLFSLDKMYIFYRIVSNFETYVHMYGSPVFL
jgi:hypothetical protein